MQSGVLANVYQDPPRPGVSNTDFTSFVFGYIVIQSTSF